uniref:Uncharacterized protein n=1 Tax=Heliothis virescens TaxID=7102 RepID=A0A2A4K567_HELVI
MNNDDDETGEVVGAQEVEDGELFYRQMKERFKALYEAKSVKLKAELLRKVVEGSSYSDEEADLKMNLIQALLLKNKTLGGGSDKPKL